MKGFRREGTHCPVRAVAFRGEVPLGSRSRLLQEEVLLDDDNIVDDDVLAFRWNDASPDAIGGYLLLLRAGHPNELRWLTPDEIQRFR